jgi:hypothetical protein
LWTGSSGLDEIEPALDALDALQAAVDPVDTASLGLR